MRLLLVFLLLVLSGSGNSAMAQQPTTSVVSSDKADMKAYRTLFRQAALYKTLADKAETTPTPKPELRRILAARYGFNDNDNATLQRLALAYQAEAAVIHQQVLAVFKKDQVRFPLGKIPQGADTSPSPELKDLQTQAAHQHARRRLSESPRKDNRKLQRTSAHEIDTQRTIRRQVYEVLAYRTICMSDRPLFQSIQPAQIIVVSPGRQFDRTNSTGGMGTAT
jgi:hypothetical protein